MKKITLIFMTINVLFSTQINSNDKIESLLIRNECDGMSQEECEYLDYCEWRFDNVNTIGFCTEKDVEEINFTCLNDCNGSEYLNQEENYDQLCDWVISISSTECTSDCEDDILIRLELVVEDCYNCLIDQNIECLDLFEDNHEEEFEDECRYFESEDECLSVGCSWNDEDGCYGNWDEEDNDCDESLMCAPVLTCIENLLYPTSCGPDNCDNPIDVCSNEDTVIGSMKLASGSAIPGNDFIMDIGYLSNVPLGGIQFNIIDNPNWLNGVEFISDYECFQTNFNEVDGNLIAIMFSLDGCILNPTDEYIRFGRIHWQVSDEALLGETVNLMIDNLIVSDQVGNQLLFNTVNSELLIAGQFGDINNDSAVNVIDIVALVNFILQLDNPDSFQFGLADINQDNELNVLDVVEIVNFILNNNSFVKHSISDQTKAYLKNNTLLLDGDIGGLEFRGELISEIEGTDILSKSKDLNLIYNLNGFLNSKKLEFISEPLNIIVSDINGKQIKVIKITDFKLNEAYPNPFNPVTNISYSIPQNTNITIKIYDIAGNVVETILNGYQEMGHYSVIWNAENNPSGLYFIQMKTKTFNKTRKLILIK